MKRKNFQSGEQAPERWNVDCLDGSFRRRARSMKTIPVHRLTMGSHTVNAAPMSLVLSSVLFVGGFRCYRSMLKATSSVSALDEKIVIKVLL